jgi:hypothetical protein
MDDNSAEPNDACLHTNYLTSNGVLSATFIDDGNATDADLAYRRVSTLTDDNGQLLTMAVVKYNVRMVCISIFRYCNPASAKVTLHFYFNRRYPSKSTELSYFRLKPPQLIQ